MYYMSTRPYLPVVTSTLIPFILSTDQRRPLKSVFFVDFVFSIFKKIKNKQTFSWYGDVFRLARTVDLAWLLSFGVTRHFESDKSACSNLHACDSFLN